MAKKLWGGRFSKATHPLVEEFTRSIHYDKKLARYDVFGTLAHVQILKKARYLTPGEARKLTKALGGLYKAIVNGTFRADAHAEDIHTDIQNKLLAKVGDLALKLHTARSRNDQVIFATKAYAKTECAKLIADVGELKAALEQLAAKHKDFVIPGFTHLQHAQPVYLKDYLSSYAAMLSRDSAKLAAIASAVKLTMGAGALAGTPIDARHYCVKIPGLELHPVANSLDTVSDRDFVIEILGAAAIIGMHLSRLAEDLILWSTKEFGFVDIDDAFCTGSSLMPQKKNPDVLELVRGYAGRLNGNLISVLTMMKGLPLSYNRDMQLDKEPLFNSIETVSGELKVLAQLVKTLKFNKTRIEAYLEDESLYATDIVYYLVDKGVPFKTAHTIVGKLVRHAIESRIEIKSMSDAELKKYSDRFKSSEILKLFNPKVSVESKRSIRRGR